ncbi:MAG: Maf family protein [Oscillospiraceae bacterium]|nr:Maf family protein [Oscillospiraceae bacterium]
MQAKILILASGSPRRLMLLEPLAKVHGYDIIVDVSNIDEGVAGSVSPTQMVENLAYRKGQAVATRYDAGIPIVAADTTVAFQGEIFEKPNDEANARAMLTALSGNTHIVYTGVYCRDANGVEHLWHEQAHVTFKHILPLLDWYMQTGESFDKAGAYGAQGHGGVFIEGIDGDINTVIGLPLIKLEMILAETPQGRSPALALQRGR